MTDPDCTRKDEMSKTHSCSARALAVLRGRELYPFCILIALFGLCTLFYYLGELVDIAGWEALRLNFFYDVHDIHRLFFLAPIIYAGYVYRVKGALFVTIAAFIVFLPRALFISSFPEPVLRSVLFAIVAGIIGALTGMVRNESERRSRLEAVARSERDRMFRMLENMEEGVLITGPDYRIRYVNESMVREFGEGMGSHCYEYLHSFDSPCGQICKLPKVTSGATERFEYNFPNGRTYDIVASPFVDSDGVVCQLATFRDITQRKQVELELIELDKLRSELLSNVSHELRSPLTSIKGIVSSLQQEDIEWDDQTREMLLTGISEETDRLASLVTNLLNMSKIGAGVWKPQKECHNISDIISETLEQQKWVHRKHTFETDLEPDLPEIYADYNQIKQVLLNLLENAVAYSEEGARIVIKVRAVDGEVEVSVSDQGVGIPIEELGKIFDKFHRGSQTRQRPGGTGLGLTICQAIILAHGGRIWAESEVGRGSTFYFRLPVADPAN
jgi:K+-sensing histidine kinase KdpD